MTYRQPPPFCIQVEPVEGCNLRCGFCGIRGIREQGTRDALSGPYHFMEVGTATALGAEVAALGWSSRIEIAMHGEPTMHPALPDLVATLRAALPRASILLTTNGVPLLDRPWGAGSPVEALLILFGAGINTFGLDDYRPHQVAPLIRDAAGFLADRGITVTDYPAEPGPNPNARFRKRRVVIIEDLATAETGTHARLANHCGAAGPLDPTYNTKRCALPFREIAVRWDGQIALCCDDWRGEFRVGSVADGLDAAWHSPALYAARRALYAGHREAVGPCDGCTNVSSRVGLLPDGTGTRGGDRLGPPQPDDKALLAAATAAGPLAPVVLRRWER